LTGGKADAGGGEGYGGGKVSDILIGKGVTGDVGVKTLRRMLKKKGEGEGGARATIKKIP